MQLEGIDAGQEIPREAFDELIMEAADISPKTLEDYVRRGKSGGYWTVNAKHGKGGRGSVVFLGEAS